MAMSRIRVLLPSTRIGLGRLLESATTAVVLVTALAALVLAGVPGTKESPAARAAFTVALLLATTAAAGRVLLAAQRQPWRARCLSCLAVCILTFGAGVLQLAAGDGATPQDSRILFQLSVSALLGFVVFDIQLPNRQVWALVVEMGAIVGGGLCLAAMPLLVSLILPSGGASPVVIAVLYSVIDLVICGVIVLQIRKGMRTPTLPTRLILLACVGLATTDLIYLYLVQAGRHPDGLVFLLVYFAIFAVLVTGACAMTTYPELRSGVEPAIPMVLVGVVAVVVLALSDPPGPGTLTTVAGIVTLAAVLIRMILALRQARLAAGALHLSRTDELTGLLNRRALLFHLDEMTSRGTPFALLLMDLDKFKEINDTLGHVAGDAALIEISGRLADVLGPDGHLARLGGDEFAVLIAENEEPRLVRLADSIRARLAPPMELAGQLMSVDVSIGVSMSRGADRTASELLREADVAMYRAKTTRSGSAFYSDTRDEHARTALQLSQLLREDLRHGRVEMRYQGQIDSTTGALVGAQALAGWRHPSGEVWSEARLLRLARQAGLLPKLIETVITRARSESAAWLRSGMITRISFACETRELLSAPIRRTLFESIEFDPTARDSLMVQITEESFLAGEDKVGRAIRELRTRGVQVSIDNYGVGFSSLSLLKDLPIQELRIDASFVELIGQDQRRQAIVASSSALARSLGIRLVAPGVRDDAQIELLTSLGVEVLQGDAIAAPLSAVEFGRWARQVGAGSAARRHAVDGSSVR
ncbi:EAL domain-containing protein [Nakamurella silvestris]|nr:EAL domain-containing protein [Nakamurella silvestris]